MNINMEQVQVVSNYTEFTKNELNNVVYLCLKYTFGKSLPCLDNPSNSDIYNILLEIHDDTDVDSIIEHVILYVKEKFNMKFNEKQVIKYRNHMWNTIRYFMKEPEDLRNDLGDDRDVEEFITKH